MKLFKEGHVLMAWDYVDNEYKKVFDVGSDLETVKALGAVFCAEYYPKMDVIYNSGYYVVNKTHLVAVIRPTLFVNVTKIFERDKKTKLHSIC